MNKRHGFTLVELMTVIAITSILIGIAVPSFREIVNSQRIKSASYELYSSLIVARSEAVKRNTDVTITAASGGWQNGWQITYVKETVLTVLKTHGALNNIIVTSTPSSIVYKRTGRITAIAAPTFQLDVNPANTNYVRCISIDLSGLPKTSKGVCT
jgi:type IV fimbrial biogenesis protein FimT